MRDGSTPRAQGPQLMQAHNLRSLKKRCCAKLGNGKMDCAAARYRAVAVDYTSYATGISTTRANITTHTAVAVAAHAVQRQLHGRLE